MKRTATALLLAALVATSAVTAAGAAAATESQGSASVSEAQDGSAYAQTHVDFDVRNNAVVDYAVGGDTALEEVKVQAESETDGGVGAGLGIDLSAVTSVDGSALSLGASTNAEAEIDAEGSASMTAHDNDHGILVVESGGDDQVVVANVSEGASAESESDSQVEVTTENGTEGAFVVAGNGSVTVNEQGDVSAKLNGDSRLVFRAYPDEKSEQDEQIEAGIASGTVTGEAYVEQQDGEIVTDAVTYSQETAIEAEQSAENNVTVTVDRAQEEGKVVVTSVSEEAVGSVEDLAVTVDGEAAVEASSYSELEGAIGGDSSKYMVEQSSSANATADVYVALNHFSERTMQMTGSDGSNGGDSGDGESGSSVPGFGVAAALVGVLGAALYALRQ